MAHFLKHEPCPSCGSRDNLGRYSDGSAFCFGCGYTERPSISPFVGERNGQSKRATDGHLLERHSCRGTTIPAHVVDWLGKYEISVDQAIKAGWWYNQEKDSLVFPFYDDSGTLVCTQERNFNPKRASKAKYFNRGEKSESCTIYQDTTSGLDPRGRVVVLTEDAVSALKISPYKDAMPLLGTHISRDKLSWLKRRYSGLQVWLDGDKWKEAVSIANAAKLMGMQACAVYTELDPKEYSVEQIKEILK